ncbi:MAG: hypothetical protein V7746_20395 [Halioglobus sp.]
MEINIQPRDARYLDKLKEQFDMGIQQDMVGVNMKLWGKPRAVKPIIDRYLHITHELELGA